MDGPDALLTVQRAQDIGRLADPDNEGSFQQTQPRGKVLERGADGDPLPSRRVLRGPIAGLDDVKGETRQSSPPTRTTNCRDQTSNFAAIVQHRINFTCSDIILKFIT